MTSTSQLSINGTGNRSHGFTLIEVLVAILIFVISSLVFIDLTTGAKRATIDTREISTATWLLQNVITELETKIETEGIGNGCDKKMEGKFDAPHSNFTWTTYCTEIDFHMSQAAAAMARENKEDSSGEPKKEDQITKMILEAASTYVTASLRELHAEVTWTSGKRKRSVDVTTHFVNLDRPFAFSSGGT